MKSNHKCNVINMRGVVGLIIPIALLFCPAMHIGQSKRPDLPFFDWNACPFEGCKYGPWTAKKPVMVYDTWKHSRKVAAKLAEGDKVVAITGVVITYQPGIIRMDRDQPQDGLKQGDLIYTYAYRGEAAWDWWVNNVHHDGHIMPYPKQLDGKGCQRDCAATELQTGKKEWWAKIKLKSGKTA
jgi:hypothetical protein